MFNLITKQTIRRHSNRVLALSSFACIACLGSRNADAQVEPTPSAALLPSTPKAPAELPPSAPQVTCTNNQLTIIADNSTMSSILAAVRSCIAATIDLPPGIDTGRIFLHLGPGPFRTVLDELLSSTDLDYVMQGSPSNSNKIETVLITTRTQDATDLLQASRSGSSPSSGVRRAWMEQRRAANASRTQEDNVETGSGSSEMTPPDASSLSERQDTKTQGPAATDANAPVGPAIPAVVSGVNVGVAGDSAASAGAGSPVPSNSPDNVPATPASATPETPAPPASGVPTDAKPTPGNGDQQMQDRITNMQQLFEKRKEMQQQAQPQSTPQH